MDNIQVFITNACYRFVLVVTLPSKGVGEGPATLQGYTYMLSYTDHVFRLES